MKLAVLTGYYGRNFAGSQFQPNLRTVEGEFIRAGISCGAWGSAEEAKFRTAGRTDRGVSARQQLVSVETAFPERFSAAMNFHLPSDIWCLGCTEVPGDFFPRYAAGVRTYRYFYSYPLDLAVMNSAAKDFCGTHDFSGFAKMEAGRDPVRTVISARVFAGADGLPVFEVSAKSFLWNMVRGMAGMLEAVGLHLAPADAAANQLASHVWRVHPASASGLVFWGAETGLDFVPMRQRREVKRMLFSEAFEARAVMRTAEALMGEGVDAYLREAAERGYGSFCIRESRDTRYYDEERQESI
ncbi:MAG: tRNA pseudouridine(38-40) synthase TruA [Methanocorpusculum sp.]|nr:tRNA pseudouridine(38-40) synthase TruA [Methanocorpusculum sp.]